MSGFDIWDVGAMVDNNNILPTGPAFLSDETVQGISFAFIKTGLPGPMQIQRIK